MISKYMTFGALAAGALIWGLAPQMDSNVGSTDTNYSPRELLTEQERDAAGAAEITRMLLGDIETGEINSQGLIELRKKVIKKAEAQARTQTKNTEISWAEMGPDNVGGRARAIFPVNKNLIYTGGVSGGLWVSEDGANTWSQVTTFPSMMVSSIAVCGNGDIYVGTGSAFDNYGGTGASGFNGRGIYWSNDGGQTWEMVNGTDPGEFNSNYGSYTAVDALEPHPTNDDLVWFGSRDDWGTIEAGVLDESPATGGPAGGVMDIVIASDASYILLVEDNAKVYKSEDSSFSSFETLTQGGSNNGMLPTGNCRVRVDISTLDPNHAFALYASGCSAGGVFAGLYHSSQAGAPGTWEEVWPAGSDEFTPLERAQGEYDLALGVSRNQPDLAYVGGISLWRSGPNQQAEMAAASIDVPGLPFGVHADIHEIVFTEEGTMFVATDGGIYKSTDGGYSYTECNHKLNITQFYGMAYSANSAVLGGTQDNGSLLIPNNGYYLSNQNAVEVNGGDGFDCAISQVTESEETTWAWFAASQNGGLVRGTVAPGSFSNFGMFYTDEMVELMNEDFEIGQFYTCTRLWEDTEDEDSQMEVIIVNPYGETVTDSTFALSTNSQNLPFEYSLADGEELLFYDEIIRPERILEEPLEEDPDYFWLAPQIGVEAYVCEDDTLSIDTIQVVDEIFPNVIDTVMIIDGEEFPVTIDLGSDTIWMDEVVYEIVESCDTMYVHAGDTINDEPGRLKVRDPYNTMFTIGFNGTNGIWMTREGLNYNTQPTWVRLGDAPYSSGAKAIEYVVADEHNGDVMFVSGWDGSLHRYTGLSEVYTQEDLDEYLDRDIIETFAGVVTGVACDPNDANHVVISIGGYGPVSGGHVQETWNALDEVPDWDNIWNVSGLNSMPMYDVVIDFQDETGATIIVGTEYGAFITDNGGDDWSIANLGMAATAESLAAPIFDLKQQWRGETNWSIPTNTGAIYAGTHGRGIFRSDDFLGADEPIVENNSIETLLVFPNPAVGSEVQVSTAGFVGMTEVEVFDLQGRKVVSQTLQNAQATERTTLDVSSLSNGTYVVRLVSQTKSLATKLIVRR